MPRTTHRPEALRYQEALAYLRSREKFGIKFGLENIDRLARALGRPERRYPSILIAGTNGKGSTAALLTSILTAAGLRVGRYTSPHIRSIEERIEVGGAPMSRQALAATVGRVSDISMEEAEPTFFEAVTATALAHFADRGVDVAVLEVGMGGRWDATNIVPAEIAAITPIGFDHERFLGDTIAEIAAEKAAIIKEGRPVVVGRLHPDAFDVVREEAEKKRAPLIVAARGVSVAAEPAEVFDWGQRVRLSTERADYGSFLLPLHGAHQLDNLVLAVRIAETFSASLDPKEVRTGVEATVWPGRLQRIAGKPPLLLDAAHNVMAARELARFLAEHPKNRRVLLFGVMKDKRVEEMLRHLLPHVSHFVATRPEMSRARGPEPLAAWAREQGCLAEAILSSAQALKRARELAGAGGEVVVAGSIFLLGEIVETLEGSEAEGASVFPAAAQAPA